jgi:cell wall-associated NlpC family hydrolase
MAACASPARKYPPAVPVAAPALPGSSEVTVPASRQELMVETAFSMLGVPYRYGGASPEGFDCSGLVEFAAAGAGLTLPRTAQQQMAEGVPVSVEELAPGDLVFMHLSHKELHVGIAIDAVRFIHAPSSGGYVRIDSLVAQPYKKGFLKARRVLAPP